MKVKSYPLFGLSIAFLLMLNLPLFAADTDAPDPAGRPSDVGLTLLTGFSIFLFLLLFLWLAKLGRRLRQESDSEKQSGEQWLINEMSSLESPQLEQLIGRTHQKRETAANAGSPGGLKATIITFFLLSSGLAAHAQATADRENVMTSPGMVIMLILVLLPLVLLVWFAAIKLNVLVKRMHRQRVNKDAYALAETIDTDSPGYESIYRQLLGRKQALDFKLTDHELSGLMEPADQKGLLLNIADVHDVRYIASKRKAAKKHDINPAVIKLIMWYLGTATFWLVVGTSIGEYLGIKFVSPDVDHVSWLSFGRLRPVHTNMVFWGWSSLAMIGLGYYVVSTVSNTAIRSIRAAYWGLILVNGAVVSGSLSLMAGINNGGGEYREYIWPVMILFAGGVIVTLVNYLLTIAQRETKEIYISNWYIVAALMFLTTIAVVGYIPWWQNGLGVTIIQAVVPENIT